MWLSTRIACLYLKQPKRPLCRCGKSTEIQVLGGNEYEKDLGILETTNDDLLGDNVVVDATDKNAIKLPTAEEAQGFFNKIWSWFTSLFNTDSDTKEPENNENSTEQADSPIIEGSENTDLTTPVDNNLNTDDSTNSTEDTSSTEENIASPQDQTNSIDSENIDN